MQSSLVRLSKSSPRACIALVASLTLLLSGWTCTTMVSFHSCQNAIAQAEISSLVPSVISSGSGEVLLIIEGSGFTPQSQALWNGSALDTAFVDSRHLQTTITREIFDNFGGSPGNNVLISVRPQSFFADSTCPQQAASAPRVLVIQ